jgi:replication fork protection complex subunit Tof1/Swi1
MQFFLALRERDVGPKPKPPAKDGANGTTDPSNEKSEEEKMSLGFNLVLEVIQRGWVGWILRRMQEGMDMKPRQWTEIQAGLGCLTQLVSGSVMSNLWSHSVLAALGRRDGGF